MESSSPPTPVAYIANDHRSAGPHQAELSSWEIRSDHVRPSHVSPVARVERLPSLDLIRGIALLGILMMNIPVFGYLDSGITAVTKDLGSHDYVAFVAVGTAFEGTMRALFSMLFGAGMILFASGKTNSIHGPTVVEYYYRRLLWLVLFGVFDAFVLLWRGDILFNYGLMGMLLYPFRRLRPIWLVCMGLVCMGITLYKTNSWTNQVRESRLGYVAATRLEKAHQKPSEKELEAKASWERFVARINPDPKADAKTLLALRGDYPTVFKQLMPEIVSSNVYFTYHGAWDMLGMMFIGMALLGWGFLTNQLTTQTYVSILLVGYGLGLPLSWFFVQYTVDFYQHPALTVETYRVSPQLLYDFRRVLLALGHASLLLLIYRSRVIPWLMKALIAVGQMAFTNYLLQSIICTFFFFGYGFGYYGKLAYYQLYYVVGAVWVFQLLVSPLWLHYFRFGPFEWVWRSLTYWKPQPMRV
ncbi:DUF418 domain-containing protein [Spirosoma flavum]|uniref:DUF418 domain-containing protein n=1 Tax=Spirosoma flavum TaxID=2048557 RepID=A0ABW6AIV7_9BACT